MNFRNRYPEAILRVVAPFGSNVSAAIEASTGVADFAEKLIAKGTKAGMERSEMTDSFL